MYTFISVGGMNECVNVCVHGVLQRTGVSARLHCCLSAPGLLIHHSTDQDKAAPQDECELCSLLNVTYHKQNVTQTNPCFQTLTSPTTNLPPHAHFNQISKNTMATMYYHKQCQLIRCWKVYMTLQVFY